MNIKTVRSVEEFSALRDPWSSLLSRSNNDSLPLTHEWLFCWWRCFGGDRQLNIICAYDDERLIAIAPFMLDVEKYRGVPCNILTLMANGHAPYSDIVFDATYPVELYRKFIIKILTKCERDLIVFAKIRSSSRLYGLVSECCLSAGNRLGTKEILTTPVIDTRPDWDGYFRGRSKKFRRNLANKVNRFGKNDKLNIIKTKVRDSGADELAEIVQVSGRSWKTRVKNDLMSNHAGRNFLFGLADQFGAKEGVDLWLARSGDKAIAYEFHITYNSVVYPLRADYDEAFAPVSPGSVLEYRALQSLFADPSVGCYYSCADSYQYLRNWTTDAEHCVSVEVFRDSVKGRVLHGLEYKFIPILRNVRDRIRVLFDKLRPKLTAHLAENSAKSGLME